MTCDQHEPSAHAPWTSSTSLAKRAVSALSRSAGRSLAPSAAGAAQPIALSASALHRARVRSIDEVVMKQPFVAAESPAPARARAVPHGFVRLRSGADQRD